MSYGGGSGQESAAWVILRTGRAVHDLQWCVMQCRTLLVCVMHRIVSSKGVSCTFYLGDVHFYSVLEIAL